MRAERARARVTSGGSRAVTAQADADGPPVLCVKEEVVRADSHEVECVGGRPREGGGGRRKPDGAAVVGEEGVLARSRDEGAGMLLAGEERALALLLAEGEAGDQHVLKGLAEHRSSRHRDPMRGTRARHRLAETKA